MPLLYHAYMYLEFLILACTIYILAPEDGKLSSLPDIEEIEEEEYYYGSEPVTLASQNEMGVSEQIMYVILEGL